MYSKIIKVDIVFNHPMGKFPYGFKARLFPAVSNLQRMVYHKALHVDQKCIEHLKTHEHSPPPLS